MIVDCAAYVNGVRAPGSLAVSDAFEAARGDGAFVWIGLYEPTTDEFTSVQRELELHPLAIEDAVRAHQRPKLEVFDNSLFAVVKTASYDDERETIDMGEIHVFVGDGFVVTVRHGPFGELQSIRRELERQPAQLALGPGAVLHAVLDRCVDQYQQVVEAVDLDLDQLEEEVFSSRRRNTAERTFRLQRQVRVFQRAVIGLRDPLERLMRGSVPAFCTHESLAEYFRDVQDHVLRISARTETASDTLASALHANLAQVSVRQNEDMRAISGWAAVIAVPTLLAGVWGMNFDHMPELHWTLGYPLAIGTIVGSALAVRWKLKKNGWL